MTAYLRNGETWFDTDNNPIQAHGGGILVHEGVYYWYGEQRSRFNEFTGIPCYTSTDLLQWTCQGVVLSPVTDDEQHDLYVGHIIERPKVVYNSVTGKFVMWMHVEDGRYAKAHAGVAVSESPLGPFVYLGSMRPNGSESRDMTVFQDDDGKAYLIHSTDGNRSLQINLLSDDYLSMEGTSQKAFVDLWREAPALFKYEGTYHLIASGCTGFSPNASLHAVSASLWGDWELQGNPFTGPGAESSYHAQPTYVIPVIGCPDRFVLMMDHWKANKLDDSRYVWLPIDMNQQQRRLSFVWLEQWNLESRTEGVYRERPVGGKLTILRHESIDLTESQPDAIFTGKDNTQPSGFLWVRWSEACLHVELAVRDGFAPAVREQRIWDQDHVSLWIDYHQLSLAFTEQDEPIIVGGTYLDQLPGLETSLVYRQAPLSVTARREIRSSLNGTEGEDPTSANWTLFRIAIKPGIAALSSFREGDSIAFAVCIVRHQEGKQHRFMLPDKGVYLDTNTYYEAIFANAAK